MIPTREANEIFKNLGDYGSLARSLDNFAINVNQSNTLDKSLLKEAEKYGNEALVILKNHPEIQNTTKEEVLYNLQIIKNKLKN